MIVCLFEFDKGIPVNLKEKIRFYRLAGARHFSRRYLNREYKRGLFSGFRKNMP